MLKSLFKFNLKFDFEVTLLTILTTLVTMVDYYSLVTTGEKAVDRFLFYFVGSLFLIVVVFRKPLKEYGFSFGDWRAGLTFTLIGVAIGTPIIWWSAQDPVMIDYYAHLWSPVRPVLTFLDLIGWELLFRGLLLFGYARLFGAHALWLAAVPFAYMHLGKPALETLSTIFGGFVFGLVAWRSRSFVYPFLIHWYINTLIIYLAFLNAAPL